LKRLSLLLIAAVALGFVTAARAETISVSDLPKQTHVHGLAIDREDPAYLLIATHHGLFRAGPDGAAELISPVQDFMGFSPHPADRDTLFASGHPAGGGNLGVIKSTDRGRTWMELAPGVDGPVDFHQMSVSPIDPQTIYGAYEQLQISRDGGVTWTKVAPLPDKLIDFAASARRADTLYAATETGLSVSTDAGVTWKELVVGAPVTLIEVTGEGAIYVFEYGKGLLRATEDKPIFEILNADFGDSYLLHLAVDPNDASRLFAASRHGEVIQSVDGGKTWTAFAAK